jgi:hypothetical protein
MGAEGQALQVIYIALVQTREPVCYLTARQEFEKTLLRAEEPMCYSTTRQVIYMVLVRVQEPRCCS